MTLMDTRLSLSRRQLLAYSTSIATLCLTPTSIFASPLNPKANSGLQSWLKRMSPDAPAAQSGQLQRWIVRHLGGKSALSVGLVYRTCPDQPFELFRGSHLSCQGGISVQVLAGAIDGLVIQRLDRPEAECDYCRFGGLLEPDLAPGHYAILINSGPRRWRPDWSLMDRDSGQGLRPALPSAALAWQDMTLLSLDVQPV